MILSNEPGFYAPRRNTAIRLETLLLVQPVSFPSATKTLSSASRC